MSDARSSMTLNRRGFLHEAGVVAVAVTVPSWVLGCGAGAGERAPVRSVGLHGRPPCGAVSEEVCAQAAALEADAVYSAAQPGPWQGKAASHVPQVSFRSGAVELVTRHGMSPEHWIDAQYVRDQDGALIGFASHVGTDEEARAVFSLPPGTTAITAYSHCNVHGDWSAPVRRSSGA